MSIHSSSGRKRPNVCVLVVQTQPKSSLRAIKSKTRFSWMKILLDDDPGKNVPEYAERLSKFVMKGFQAVLVTSKDEQGAGDQEGAIKVPFSPPARIYCRRWGKKPIVFSCPRHSKSIRRFTSWVVIFTTKTWQLGRPHARKSVNCMRAPRSINAPKTAWVQHVIVWIVQTRELIGNVVRIPTNPFHRQPHM